MTASSEIATTPTTTTATRPIVTPGSVDSMDDVDGRAVDEGDNDHRSDQLC
jgi:hypothetical protein